MENKFKEFVEEINNGSVDRDFSINMVVNLIAGLLQDSNSACTFVEGEEFAYTKTRIKYRQDEGGIFDFSHFQISSGGKIIKVELNDSFRERSRRRHSAVLVCSSLKGSNRFVCHSYEEIYNNVYWWLDSIDF